MRKVTITFTDEQFNRFSREVGEILGIAAFMETPVIVEDDYARAQVL